MFVIYVASASVESVIGTFAEVIVVLVDSRVDHVNADAITVTNGIVGVIERETDLVDAVQTPGFDGVGKHDAILFDVFNRLGLTELGVEKRSKPNCLTICQI